MKQEYLGIRFLQSFGFFGRTSFAVFGFGLPCVLILSFSKYRKLTGKVTLEISANSDNFRDQASDINVCESVHSKTVFSGK